jgi:hypothetical protein
MDIFTGHFNSLTPVVRAMERNICKLVENLGKCVTTLLGSSYSAVWSSRKRPATHS